MTTKDETATNNKKGWRLAASRSEAIELISICLAVGQFLIAVKHAFFG